MFANDIKFRNKFTQKVKFSSVGEVTEFKWLFAEILNHSAEFIIGLLWSLTYDPSGEVSPERYLTFIKRLNSFPSEQREVICNELRYQYAMQNPHFLNIEESDLPSYQALVRSSSEVTAYVVCQKCKELKMCSPDFIKREIYFLNNEDEDKRVKAIKHLNFNTQAANFLKPYAKEIASLLEAITSSEATASKSQFLEQKEAQPHSSQDETSLQSAKHQVDDTNITAEVIFEHRAEIAKFFQAFDNLEAHRVNPIEIVRLFPEINTFKDSISEMNSLGLKAESLQRDREKISTLLSALNLFHK